MPAAAVWLPPSDHHVGPWRFTLLTQEQAGTVVVVGAVLLSTEPGDGAAGLPLTEDVVKDLWPLVDAVQQTLPAPPQGSKLERVAAVYSRAVAARGRPVKAVAAEFGVTDGTAGNLVWKARQAGLLPPTSPGKTAA